MAWTSPGHLFFGLTLTSLWAIIPLVLTDGSGNQNCNVQLSIDPASNSTFNVSSPGYPDKSYTPGESFTWCISAPDKKKISLTCDEFDIPKSADCQTNALEVNTHGESKVYCGSKPFHEKSSSNQLTLKLHSSKKSRGGKFTCQVKAEELQNYNLRTIVYDDCDCGYGYRPRIVGGVETGIHEFPFMAGLVDARRGAMIICGATIISSLYVVTADHCLAALVLEQTAVVVGEHNISTLSDTSATQLIRAKRFIPYPFYNSENNRYDIALIELMSPIKYSTRVGPVCLPFGSRHWDLTGEFIKVLGWGTTEFGGPRSKVLRKVDLQLVDIEDCIDAYGSNVDPYTQLCTYKKDADACQYDSGGPLVYFNGLINRFEIVGVVGYGRGCASEAPGVNTEFAPFLQWIIDQTPSETYCFKTQM